MKSITQVMQNLVKPYIDTKDKAYAANIAPVEVSPAEAAHTAGTQLIYNGVLYDVTADIAINDDLATEGAGANISAASKVTEQLATISGNLTTETTNRQNADNNISDVIGRNGAKNLLPFNKAVNTQGTWNGNVYTHNGIEYTVNDDGTIIASGTASAGSEITINVFTLKAGSYKFSGTPSGGSRSSYFIYHNEQSVGGMQTDVGSGASFTVNDAAHMQYFRIQIANGYAITGTLVFKPMLTLASQPDSDYAHYEPYSKTNQQLTDGLDGTIETVALNGAHNLFDIEKWLKAGTATYTKSGNSYTITVLSGLYTPMVLFDTAQDVIVHGSLTAVGSTTGRIELLDSADAVLVQLNQSTSFPVKVNGVSKIRFNWGTAPTSFTISDFMICLQTDKSSTYAPYTKTNRELTEDLAGTNLLAEIKQLTVTFEASDTIGTQLGRLYTAFTSYCATLDDDDFIIPWALTIAGYEPLIYQGSGMYTKASSAINALFISFALGASNMNIYRACVRSASPYLQNFTQSGSTSSLAALTDDARTSGQNMSLLVYRYKKV